FRDPSWLMWKSEGVIVGRLLLFPVVCGVPVDVDGVVDEPEALGPGGGAPSLVPPSGFLAGSQQREVLGAPVEESLLAGHAAATSMGSSSLRASTRAGTALRRQRARTSRPR